MPELPEVETVVRDLRPHLQHAVITHVKTSTQSLRRTWRKSWSKKLCQKQIKKVDRRGKWIMIELQPEAGLLVHLGMTGQWTLHEPHDDVASHTHVTLTLHSKKELRFRDVRRFGSFQFYDSYLELQDEVESKLGPEPDHLHGKTFHESLVTRHRPIKSLLLDQKIVAGIGNIYADESLFLASLHPLQLGSSLKITQSQRLADTIQQVIKRAVALRGSTIRDYVGGSGLQGEYQHEFTIYGRQGETCPRCDTLIQVVRVAGRSSHFCPCCQQLQE